MAHEWERGVQRVQRSVPRGSGPRTEEHHAERQGRREGGGNLFSLKQISNLAPLLAR